MKVTYDASINILRIILSDTPVAESDEEKPGTTLDYAEDGSLIRIEIRDASSRISNPERVEYSVVGITHS